MRCNDCGQEMRGDRCDCGWKAPGVRDERVTTVNYCEWGNCGIPCSIGPTAGFHHPRLCPWHREIDRFDQKDRPERSTFECFQAWRQGRASTLPDSVVWDAILGRTKLTYRP